MITLPHAAGQTYAVLGLGRTGLSAAAALAASGARVLAWDDRRDRRDVAAAAGVPLTDLMQQSFSGVAGLVLSPGIPHRFPAPHPVAARARDQGCELLSDLELMWRSHPEMRAIGITGTNGKSTTTALVSHVLTAAGCEVQTGGNIGLGVLALEAGRGDTRYVLELSSYQLDLTPGMRFSIAVLLNISPDHLERHGGLDGYVAAKRHIFSNQKSGDVAIVGQDDAWSLAILEELRANSASRTIIPVSAVSTAAGGVFVRDSILHDDRPGGDGRVCDLSSIATLPGRHNWQNAAAAYAVARAVGIDASTIAGALATYPGLPHRQEIVARAGQVVFVNDSKATNVAAACTALDSYERIYWIAGGQAKDETLTPLLDRMDHVHGAFLIGEAANAFARALGDNVVVTQCGDLATAVARASAAAAADAAPSVVLLSPACASFDQFSDFADRGDRFRQLVQAQPIPMATARAAP